MLKRFYKTKAEIPENELQFYVEKDDGWYLDVEAAPKDNDGGGSSEDGEKLKEFRDRNIQLGKELDKARSELGELKKKVDGLDFEKYERAMQALDKLEGEEDRKLIEEGKLEEVVERRTRAAIQAYVDKLDAKDKAYKDLEKKYSETRNHLGRRTLEQAAQLQINELGLRPQAGSLTDILSRVRSTFQMSGEDKFEAKDENGEPLYGEDGSPLTLTEYIRDHLAQKATHLFQAAKGGDASGNDSGRGTPGGQRVIRADDRDGFSRNLADIAAGKVSVVKE